MGDEELNFTEEEARYWADDPRNHALKEGTLVWPLVVWFPLVIAALTIIWVVGSSATPH